MYYVTLIQMYSIMYMCMSEDLLQKNLARMGLKLKQKETLFIWMASCPVFLFDLFQHTEVFMSYVSNDVILCDIIILDCIGLLGQPYDLVSELKKWSQN